MASDKFTALYNAFLSAGFTHDGADAKAKEVLAGLDAEIQAAEDAAILAKGILLPLTGWTMKGERCTYVATGAEAAANGKVGRTVKGWKVSFMDADGTLIRTAYGEKAEFFANRVKALEAEDARLRLGGHDKDTTFTVIKRAD